MALQTWELLHKGKEEIKDAEQALDILLENRGIKTRNERDEFLNPTLDGISIENTGIDAKEVKKTLKKIDEVIQKNGKIVIYGDYDVDGICGTAILWETIYGQYKNVFPYIPHRTNEGYGLSVKGIDNILTEHEKIDLLITVDNGIVANEAVDYANSKGIDVIVTDHHAKGSSLPNAYSIVHTTSLCGTGVAYLLSKELGSKNDFLELVALATVADLVPLVGANRAFVKYGIEDLRKTKRPGLLELLKEAKVEKKEIGTYHIGHIIAPRLNATGRIAHALDSLRLICTRDDNRAKELAKHLAETNKNRQSLTEESIVIPDLIAEEKIIISHDASYNEGVIGLVASRIVEKHYRPAIVMSVGEEHAKGSARSIKGFNIIEFFRSFEEVFINVGGHPMAAGFTIETARIEEFKKIAAEKAKELLTEDLFNRVLAVDMEIDFSNVNHNLLKAIKKLEPYGMQNPEPIFLSRNVEVKGRRKFGKQNNHMKLILSENDTLHEGLLFNVGDMDIEPGQSMDVVYAVSEDEWNGRKKITLKIKDFNL